MNCEEMFVKSFQFWILFIRICYVDAANLVNGNIPLPDNAISSSSVFAGGYEPWNAKFGTVKDASKNGGWRASDSDLNPFIQFDFWTPRTFKGVITQKINQSSPLVYTETYQVSHSSDGLSWTQHESGTVYTGNDAATLTEVQTDFNSFFTARFVRIYPLSHTGGAGGQFEIIGDTEQDISSNLYNSGCGDMLVNGADPLDDSMITSSSFCSINSDREPWSARLNYSSAFGTCGDNSPYLQVKLWALGVVNGVIIEPGHSTNKLWSFYVEFSLDGNSWITVKDTDLVTDKIFPGNRLEDNENSLVRFPLPVSAKYIRIYPSFMHIYYRFRFEILGCYVGTYSKPELVLKGSWALTVNIHRYDGTVCASPLIHGNDPLEDYMITGDFVSNYYEPWAAHIDSSTCWYTNGAHVQIEFWAPALLTGIMTQSRPSKVEHHTRSYYVDYSMDGYNWQSVNYTNGPEMLFPANYIENPLTTQRIPEPIYARFLRLKPYSYSTYRMMRFEVLGCYNQSYVKPDYYVKDGITCKDYLLNGNNPLNDQMITGNFLGAPYEPWTAKINSSFTWIAKQQTSNEYIQLWQEATITGIVLQSRNGKPDHHTRSFYLDYSNNGLNWTRVVDADGVDLLFPGNTYEKTLVQRPVFHPFNATYVRIRPFTFSTYVSGRFEILGCYSAAVVPEQMFQINGTFCGNPLVNGIDPVEDYMIQSKNGYYSYTCDYEPWNARINSSYSWIATNQDKNQYFQIELWKQALITGILMQHRTGKPDHHIRSFYVEYSDNAVNWTMITDEFGDELLFPGNTGNEETVMRFFENPIHAHYVRIRPFSYSTYVSGKFDVLGCYEGPIVKPDYFVYKGNTCNSYLIDGDQKLQNFMIRGDFLSQNSLYEPWTANVNSSFSYIASKSQYGYGQVLVEFWGSAIITGVVLQSRFGRPDHHIRSFYLDYGDNGLNWTTVTDKLGMERLFTGNNVEKELVVLPLFEPIAARYVRVRPRGWCTYITMRFDFLGCYAGSNFTQKNHYEVDNAPCNDLMVNGTYPLERHMIRSSSVLGRNQFQEPWKSTINSTTSWVGTLSTKDSNIFVQVKLWNPGYVTGIITQARADNPQHHVRSFYLLYSQNGYNWTTYKDVDGSERCFAANTDNETLAVIPLDNPIYAKYIRLTVRSWSMYAGLRFEVMGCYKYTNWTTPSYFDVDGVNCMDFLVNGTDPINEKMVQASSIQYYNQRMEPWTSFLDATSTWSPDVGDSGPYIQAQFWAGAFVTAIQLQPKHDDLTKSVQSFFIDYSSNALNWTSITEEDGYPKLFPALQNGYDSVVVPLQEPIYTRFIRIRPYTYSVQPYMRFDILGCYNDTYVKPVYGLIPTVDGVACTDMLVNGNDPLTDNMIQASSMNTRNSKQEPWTARIDASASWTPSQLTGEFIKIELWTHAWITAIVLQSSHQSPLDHVRSFYVHASEDNVNWSPVPDAFGLPMLFIGNTDDQNLVTRPLYEPVYAKYIKIQAYTWSGALSMRFDVIGCYNGSWTPPVYFHHNGVPCADRLVSGPVPLENHMISASSFWMLTSKSEPWTARIDAQFTWKPKVANFEQFIEVEFWTESIITGIVMQNPHFYPTFLDHVRSIVLAYSDNGSYWAEVKDDEGLVTVFPANNDTMHLVEVPLRTPILARYLRIYPYSYSIYMSMRFDVLGCMSYTPVETNATCQEALVDGANGIADEMIKSNSKYMGSGDYEPWLSHINASFTWKPSSLSGTNYVQLEFWASAVIKGIVLQKDHATYANVRSFFLDVSDDAITWSRLKNKFLTSDRLFPGNDGNHAIAYVPLDYSVMTKFLRIVPYSYDAYIAMRFDVIGCYNVSMTPMLTCSVGAYVCDTYLMESVTDGNITTSSSIAGSEPHNAKLSYPSSWVPMNDMGPGQTHFIQVKFEEPKYVTCIAIRGSDVLPKHVRSFSVGTSNDGVSFSALTDVDGTPQLFPGSVNNTHLRISHVRNPTSAVYYRLFVMSFSGGVSVKMDLLGCDTPVSTTSTSTEVATTTTTTALTTGSAGSSGATTSVAAVTFPTPAPGAPTCQCSCITLNITYSIDSPEFIEKVNQLIKETTVEKNSTSAMRRSKTCAMDDRFSAELMGTIGSVVICVVFGCIFLTDIARIFLFLKYILISPKQLTSET